MNAASLRETLVLLRWLERRRVPFEGADVRVLWPGLDRRTVQRRLDAMVAAGWCERLDGRRYGGRPGCAGALYVATVTAPSEAAT